jgi:hypothetical protein
LFSFCELVDIISKNKLCGLLWNVATGYECQGDTDAKDEGGDAVDERDEGRCRTEADFREREDDVVHDDVESYAKERAVEPGATTKWELVADEEEDCGGGEGDEEVEEQAEQGGAVAHAKGGATQDAAGYALENSSGGYAAETKKDEGVTDVERANEESGTGDDLPEWGVAS